MHPATNKKKSCADNSNTHTHNTHIMREEEEEVLHDICRICFLFVFLFVFFTFSLFRVFQILGRQCDRHSIGEEGRPAYRWKSAGTSPA